MATIAEFSIPTASFALSETLPQFPDVAVEADRIVAHGPGTTMPCLWVTDGDSDGFADALRSDRTVEEVRDTVEFDSERLFHIQWSDEIEGIVEEMINHHGVILEASGRGDRWVLRIRFISRDQVERFQAHFEEHGVPFQLEQLFEATHPRHTRGDVTTGQHEALTAALELGFFQIPREASLQDLADHLDLSNQSVSERLRRGTENLVRDMLIVEPIHEQQ